MILAWRFFKLFSWIFVRGSLHAIRDVIWFFTGVNAGLRAARKQNSYKKSAHVRKILAKHTFDHLLEPSSEKQFITNHDSFQDPEYVLQDHISLFTIDEKEACFVETGTKDDVFNSDHGAFFRLAQYKLSKKIIIMPINVFHKLCEKLPDPADKMIFANNCARCGSTLLTQVFELTGKVLAASEPDVLNALTRLPDALSKEEKDRIITNGIKMLCKPIKREITAYILKPTCPSMIATPTLHRLYPNAKHLFMYREGLPCIKSLDRLGYGLPLLECMYVFGRLSAGATAFFIRMCGLPPDAMTHKVQCRSHFAAVIWGSSIRLYLDFLESGIPMVAVKYEDMIEDAQYAFKKIFEYVNLEFDSEAVTKAFGRDSQRGSPINFKELREHPCEELTPEVQKSIDEVCDFYRLPRVPAPLDVPGNITKKPKDE